MTKLYPYANFDMAVGGIMGVLGATMNQSAGHNLLVSSGAALAGSAADTWLLKRQNRFLSRETALTNLLVTGSSVFTYNIADALIHKHHKPEMKIEVQAAEDKPCTPCQKKLWAARMENAASEQERSR